MKRVGLVTRSTASCSLVMPKAAPSLPSTLFRVCSWWVFEVAVAFERLGDALTLCSPRRFDRGGLLSGVFDQRFIFAEVPGGLLRRDFLVEPLGGGSQVPDLALEDVLDEFVVGGVARDLGDLLDAGEEVGVDLDLAGGAANFESLGPLHQFGWQVLLFHQIEEGALGV